MGNPVLGAGLLPGIAIDLLEAKPFHGATSVPADTPTRTVATYEVCLIPIQLVKLVLESLT